MLKRSFDVLIALAGLLLTSPILVAFAIAVWVQDFRSPLYIAERIGRHGKPFRMYKLRSMIADADRSGVTSTSSNDTRITAVGKLIRAFKLDELTQLINVVKGDMSLVGPRPNVMRWGVELYTDEEMKLLSVRPGITDYASIVFADEGAVLADAEDPDLSYNQLIRPWKSRLSLLYLEHQSLWLDCKLVWFTAVAIFSRPTALRLVCDELRRRGVAPDTIRVASRYADLVPHPPPGSSDIVTSRD